jgi:hypothetical protein
MLTLRVPSKVSLKPSTSLQSGASSPVNSIDCWHSNKERRRAGEPSGEPTHTLDNLDDIPRVLQLWPSTT